MKMKQMIYKEKRIEPEVLAEGDLKEHHYVILSLGTHPTAYVECKKTLTQRQEYSISAHGGITYNGPAYWNKEDNRNYIGWDYAHLGDYVGWTTMLPQLGDVHDKIWTTEEIYTNVEKVVADLVKWSK